MVVQGALSGENEVSVSGGEGFLCDQVGAGSGLFSDSGCTIETGAGAFERAPIGSVAPAQRRRPVTISSSPVPFGVESYELTHEEEGGTPATQAGAHPFQQTTSITLNQGADIGGLEAFAAEPAREPGRAGQGPALPLAGGADRQPERFPQCTDEQFFAAAESGVANLCPPQSAIGVAAVTVNEPSFLGVGEIPVPLFNLKPHIGEPARFGFNVVEGNAPVVIDTSVRTGSDYGVTVSVNNITQAAAFLSSKVTVWACRATPATIASVAGPACLKAAGAPTNHCRREALAHARAR